MPRDLEPSLAEANFLLSALSQGLRLDRRGADVFRDLTITFGPDEYGVCEVRLGKTRVACRVSAELGRPYSDRPFEGVFTCTAEVSPMASTAFEVGRPSEDEVVMSRLLEKAIRRSRALDLESLCVAAGRRCWHVRADIQFLNHDGNLLDAACIAAVASLLNYRRNDVTVQGEDILVHPITERVPVPLTMNHVPITITFWFFNGGRISLMDCTQQEERHAEGAMTLTIMGNELGQLAKSGGVALEPEIVLTCLSLARSTSVTLHATIKTAVDQDLKAKQEIYRGGAAMNAREVS